MADILKGVLSKIAAKGTLNIDRLFPRRWIFNQLPSSTMHCKVKLSPIKQSWILQTLALFFFMFSTESFSEVWQWRDRAMWCSGGGQMARKRQSDEIFPNFHVNTLERNGKNNDRNGAVCSVTAWLGVTISVFSFNILVPNFVNLCEISCGGNLQFWCKRYFPTGDT